MWLLLFFAPILQGQTDKADGSGTKTPDQQKSKTNSSSPPASADKVPSDAVHDVMTITFTSQDACSVLKDYDSANQAKNLDTLEKNVDSIKLNQPLGSWSTLPLAKAIKQECPDCSSAVAGTSKTKKSDTAYIFHLVNWAKKSSKLTTDPPMYIPLSSDWHVYQQDGLDTLKFTGFGGDGSPRIYNKKNVLIVGVDTFAEAIDPGAFANAYKSSVTQGTPQNQTDLAALITALTGISGAGPTKPQVEGQAPPKCQLFLAAALQSGTARLPFDTKINVMSDGSHPAANASVVQGLQIEGNLTTPGDLCIASSCVDLRLAADVPSVTVKVSGTFTGTLAFEVASRATAFVGAKAYQSSSEAEVSSVSVPGEWTVITAGRTDVRVRAASLTSGTAKVSLSTPTTSDLKASSASDPAKAQKPQTSAEPAPGVMTCTGNGNSLPCTSTRTFTSEDREWWDVSIGITTPGVRESKYSIVNNKLAKSETLHTDFYALLDLYPFAQIAAKDDWAPHFNLGVPVTSKSLYRPYFGMAESIGGLLTHIFRPERQISLPVGINVFAGMTWMKTQIVSGNPTTPSELTANEHWTHVWKPVFGIEVPVSSIASKIKGAGSKNSNGSGKSTGSGSGSK
jgi:hypothetical protein